MTTFQITNRPVGTQNRTIADIIQNFDDILDDLNNGGIEAENLADGAVTPIKVGSLPHVQVYSNTAQTVNNGSSNQVAWELETFDSHGMHDNVTNPERLVCKQAGVYLVSAVTRFATNATGSRSVSIGKNGGGSNVAYHQVLAGASYSPTIAAVALVRLDLNEYVRVFAGQNGVASLATDPGGDPKFARFEAVWLGP